MYNSTFLLKTAALKMIHVNYTCFSYMKHGGVLSFRSTNAYFSTPTLLLLCKVAISCLFPATLSRIAELPQQPDNGDLYNCLFA